LFIYAASGPLGLWQLHLLMYWLFSEGGIMRHTSHAVLFGISAAKFGAGTANFGLNQQDCGLLASASLECAAQLQLVGF
jgi:hypothetical protein